MISNLVLFAATASYAVIASQPFMYILALRNTQEALSPASYIESRQLIDVNMRSKFKYVIYSALLTNILLLLVNLRAPSTLVFVTAVISLLALFIDILLTVKGNLPLNDIINNWSQTNYPENWRQIRQAWFDVFLYRQIASIVGFLSLLVGAIFGAR